MIKIPEVHKGTENFWEWNPQFIDLFDELYKKDKSKNKNKSSKIMWALYHKLNPDSIYYNLADKEEVIKKKFLKDSKFNWNKYLDDEDLFKRVLLTPAERALHEWNETMKKRNTFLRGQDFTLDKYIKGKLVKGNAKDLDAMLANTAKLYQEYGKIIKDLKEDKLKRGKAGKPLSSSDANRI